MTIDNNGKVGIGTVSPGHKLDVDGDINLSGNYKVNGNNIISWIDVDPQYTEWSFSSNAVSQQTLNPNTISSSARYVLADVFIAGHDDHFNATFSRDSFTGSSRNWIDNNAQPSEVFNTDSVFNKTVFTHHGDDDDAPDYGQWYSSIVIPTNGQNVYFGAPGHNGSGITWIYIIVRAYSL